MNTEAAALSTSTKQPSLREFLLYFLRLGTLGFGGPIALAAYMQKHLVEERKWVSSEDYVEGLAFAQLSPGPLAAQLAMYLGWIQSGTLGATLTGIVFILPSFLMVLVLGALYLHYGGLRGIQAAFYGIGAVVMAIIARSAYKLVRSTVKKDWLLWILFAASAIATAWTESEVVWLFVLCGFISMFVKAPPRWRASFDKLQCFVAFPQLLTGLHGPVSFGILTSLFLFFVKAGAFVFGSGLAIVPFLYGTVVGEFHWLTERQFLDAVAIAMITPGPVVITSGFIGYLVGGIAGATLATLAVFAPPFLVVICGAPYYRRFAQNQQVKAFVRGVTAAAVGAIAGAVVILSRRSIIDFTTASIAVLTFVLFSLKKIPESIAILLGGLAGLLLFRG